jgi:hypothetical protein
MNNDILVGRKDELKLINDLMDKKRNIIMFGEEGGW